MTHEGDAFGGIPKGYEVNEAVRRRAAKIDLDRVALVRFVGPAFLEHAYGAPPPPRTDRLGEIETYTYVNEMSGGHRARAEATGYRKVLRERAAIEELVQALRRSVSRPRVGAAHDAPAEHRIEFVEADGSSWSFSLRGEDLLPTYGPECARLIRRYLETDLL